MSKQIYDPPLTLAGGWQRLSSELVYENPWIQVFHEDVTLPSGDDGIYGRIHFRGRAVGVVPLDDEQNTWLVRQSRYTVNRFTWEIPEGGAKENEDPRVCAIRELEEEVGLKAARIEELMRVHTSNSVSDEEGVVYVATGLTAGTQALDASEDIETRKLPLREAIAMALRGEITDAISVAALLRLAIDLKISL